MFWIGKSEYHIMALWEIENKKSNLTKWTYVRFIKRFILVGAAYTYTDTHRST